MTLMNFFQQNAAPALSLRNIRSLENLSLLTFFCQSCLCFQVGTRADSAPAHEISWPKSNWLMKSISYISQTQFLVPLDLYTLCRETKNTHILDVNFSTFIFSSLSTMAQDDERERRLQRMEEMLAEERRRNAALAEQVRLLVAASQQGGTPPAPPAPALQVAQVPPPPPPPPAPPAPPAGGGGDGELVAPPLLLLLLLVVVNWFLLLLLLLLFLLLVVNWFLLVVKVLSLRAGGQGAPLLVPGKRQTNRTRRPTVTDIARSLCCSSRPKTGTRQSGTR